LSEEKNSFLNSSFLVLSRRYNFNDLHKRRVPMKQISLFKPEDLPSRILYEKLFENLPHLSSNQKGGGRPPFSRDFLLKAFIYKALRRIHSLTDLVFELKNNPSALSVCAGDVLSRIPSVERIIFERQLTKDWQR